MEELRLVWIDLEMTGLNAATDAIIEIAAIITGADLHPIAKVERVVFQPERVLETMSGRVRRLHTTNGLLDEVRSSGVSLKEAERAVLTLVAQHCPPGEGILCGNSVYHDWRFLSRYMPRLEQHLHFRQIDIGTIAVMVGCWFPQVHFPRRETNHRAMADVEASLDELRYYCKHAFGVDLERVARQVAR